MSRKSRITKSELDRIFGAAVSAGVAVHVKIGPDGTIDVKTLGTLPTVSEADHDTPDKISELIRNAH